MKFGKVDHPSLINYSLPADHSANESLLKSAGNKSLRINVGCAKWNRADLKNFYPRGTKNDLTYYSSEFNSIELNATFYRFFPPEQFAKWKDSVGQDFKFYPKITQNISQFKRLKDTEELVEQYLFAVNELGDKLGGVFLQMNANFAPKDLDSVQQFVAYWPNEMPLFIELRHEDWYSDSAIADALFESYEANTTSAIITDTPGRRDLLHMRLSVPKVMIRFVCANHEVDYARLDEWVDRLKIWTTLGLKEVNFFIHQNMSIEAELKATYFVEQLNKKLKLSLAVPRNLIDAKLKLL